MKALRREWTERPHDQGAVGGWTRIVDSPDSAIALSFSEVAKRRIAKLSYLCNTLKPRDTGQIALLDEHRPDIRPSSRTVSQPRRLVEWILGQVLCLALNKLLSHCRAVGLGFRRIPNVVLGTHGAECRPGRRTQ